MESFYSDDYTLSIDLENGTDQDLPIENALLIISGTHLIQMR